MIRDSSILQKSNIFIVKFVKKSSVLFRIELKVAVLLIIIGLNIWNYYDWHKRWDKVYKWKHEVNIDSGKTGKFLNGPGYSSS